MEQAGERETRCPWVCVGGVCGGQRLVLSSGLRQSPWSRPLVGARRQPVWGLFPALAAQRWRRREWGCRTPVVWD